MKNKGFTLIELLIVVAIIAILAAIAVPNFLEAQTRSKVSRVKADLRSVAVAADSYYVDHNKYPPNDGGGAPGISQFRMNRVVVMTTPIAYLTSLPKDPFLPGDTVAPGGALDSFQYFNYDRRYNNAAVLPNWFGVQGISLVSWGWLTRNDGIAREIVGACLKSWGPDAGKDLGLGPGNRGDSGIEWAAYGLSEIKDGTPGVSRFYDPSNGTVSAGDVARFVGSVPLPQQQ